MNDTVKEKLAESLTSDTTDILPYLPYLLQDFLGIRKFTRTNVTII